MFIFSRSFPPEIKDAYFPKHLIIPLSLDDAMGRILSWKMPRAASFTSFVFREVGHFQAFPSIFHITAVSKSKSFCRKYVAGFFFLFFSLADFVCISITDQSHRSSAFCWNWNYYTPSTLRKALLQHVLYSLSPPPPPIPDLVEHIAVLQEAAQGERYARSPSYVQIKHICSDGIHFLFVW